MKLSTLLLAASLVANAAAIALFVAPAAFHPAPSAPDAATAAAKPVMKTANGAAEEKSGTVKSAKWTQLQTPDLPALIARLRTAGFPEVAVRAIISEQLRAKFADRRKAVIGEAGAYEYWKPGAVYNSGYNADPKVRAALRDLSQQQTAMLKELLGPDPSAVDDFGAAYRRRQYGSLPREKSDQVSLIAQDYSDLASQVRNAANGLMLQEDRDKLAYLEAEKHKDLAAILTPEELSDYDMRSSMTTSRLRFQLANVDLTEQQFRAIYEIQRPFDDKYNTQGGGFLSSEFMKDRREAQKQVTADIRTALGDSMATEYDHAMDQGYQSASRVVARLALPKEAIQQVVDVQKDIEARATTLRTDRNLPTDQRNAQLTALKDEATQRLTNALGTRGVQAYKDNGGYWLSNLTPPPRP